MIHINHQTQHRYLKLDSHCKLQTLNDHNCPLPINLIERTSVNASVLHISHHHKSLFAPPNRSIRRCMGIVVSYACNHSNLVDYQMHFKYITWIISGSVSSPATNYHSWFQPTYFKLDTWTPTLPNATYLLNQHEIDDQKLCIPDSHIPGRTKYPYSVSAWPTG